MHRQISCNPQETQLPSYPKECVIRLRFPLGKHFPLPVESTVSSVCSP